MSRPLRSYPVGMRRKIAERRLKDATKGLGYWAAYDFINKKHKRAAA
jgi:hypothetical protein